MIALSTGGWNELKAKAGNKLKKGNLGSTGVVADLTVKAKQATALLMGYPVGKLEGGLCGDRR